MSQLKGAQLYRKRAHSPYEVTDESEVYGQSGFNRESSLDPMKLDLIQPGSSITKRGRLQFPLPDFDTFTEAENFPATRCSETASNTGEESCADNEESFAPVASHVPVELYDLWKRIEERGFCIQEDFDQESPGEHYNVAPSAGKTPSTAAEYTMPPRGDDKPDFTPDDSDIRYPASSGYVQCDSTSKSGLPTDEFTLALAFWLQDAGISHATYTGLQEVLQLATMDNLHSLPKDIRALQRRLRGQLPLLQMHSRSLRLDPGKIACGRSINQRMFFFDIEDIIGAILNTNNIRSKMYFGMAELVDEPQELWHSMMWAESIRSCSGDFARYYPGNRTPVFPGDVVLYSCSTPTCVHTHRGRIRMIARDMRESCGTPGTIILHIDPLIHRDTLPSSLKQLVGPFQPTKTCPVDMEYFLLEDEPVLIPVALLLRRWDDVYFYRDVARTANDLLPADINYVDVILNHKTIKVSRSKLLLIMVVLMSLGAAILPEPSYTRRVGNQNIQSPVA